MTIHTFDQAQHDAWAQSTESPSEAEERAAVESGQIFPILTDSAWTGLLDAVEEAFEEMTRCGCTDRLCPCLKRADWPTRESVWLFLA